MKPQSGNVHQILFRIPFVCSILLSAFLLFNIEPLFSRMMLPLAGGSPAVWNMAMICFQTLLLAGYLYAYLLQKFFSIRKQMDIHITLLLLSTLTLPIHIDQTLAKASTDQPYITIVLVLLRGVGIVFFALSATGPLLQSWYAQRCASSSTKTYSLYAVSNAGSLIGLLAYPLILEPFTGIRVQVAFWAGGFFCFLFSIIATAVSVLRYRSTASQEAPIVDEGPLPTARQRIRWMTFAAIPTSLMLAVTMGLTTYIAPLPLLWVAPLCLYLVTFILVFSEKSIFTTPSARYTTERLFVILIVISTCAVGLNMVLPVPFEIALLLGVFFVVAMRAHTIVYDERPAPKYLTDFYLCLSFGSVVGGLFNALIAPLIFKDLYEFGITLVAACICFSPTAKKQLPLFQRYIVAGVLALVLIGSLIRFMHPPTGIAEIRLEIRLTIAAIAVLVFALSDGRRAFTVAIAAVFLTGLAWSRDGERMLYQSRNFFGIKIVTQNAVTNVRLLIHSHKRSTAPSL